jgi:type I restriction enzyme S subunit
MQKNATGTAGTMPKINGESLRNLPVPLPPSLEIAEILHLIVDGFDTINDLTELAASNRRSLKALRQSVLKSAFEGRLVPQDPSDVPASVLLAGIRAEAPVPRGARRRKS